MTLIKRIRIKCIDCSDGPKDVKECKFPECNLYPARMGKRPVGFQPKKEIKKFCLWCCIYQRVEIKLCAADECVFWPIRPYQGESIPETGIDSQNSVTDMVFSSKKASCEAI